MVIARKYVVTKRFEGKPKRDDFEIVTFELPPLKDDEILLKIEWISVDPWLRANHYKYNIPYDQFSYTLGIVIESKNKDYPIGTRVVSYEGWCDYCVVNPNKPIIPGETISYYKLPHLKGLPISLGVGALGLLGVAAYFGFLEICKPKKGDTVVVTAAAGAVGSLVGQIAKIKGCKVIGFAGSDDKVQWLEEDLKFDKAFNYKTVDIRSAIKEVAVEGVDCYFDNVGGEISSLIINEMNDFGRIAVSGSISTYNTDMDQLPKATNLQQAIVMKQLKMEGFIVWRWNNRFLEAIDQLSEWIFNGQVKVKEHITEGFENVVDAFVGMLNGENTGKAVVKV